MAYLKYGLENFKFEILEECKLEEFNNKEKFWIKLLKPQLKLRNHNLGKKQSEETKNKRKQTFKEKKENGYVRNNENYKKKVICIETGEIFNSLNEVNEKYNLTTLCGHLKGKYKTCKGKHYQYYQGNSSVTTMGDECSPVG